MMLYNYNAARVDISKIITNIHSAGVIEGGIISDAGGGNINISEGSGYLREIDTDTGKLKQFSWDELLNQPIPVGTARYVGVTYNSGDPIVILKTADTWNNHTEFRLGSVVNDTGTLHILNNPWRAVDPINYINERFFETKPLERADRIGGLLLGNTGTRNVTVSAGELYDITNEFDIAAIDTSGANTFDSYYDTTKQGSAIKQWDNLNYNNAGVLTPITPNLYANLWWYIEADGNLVMMYGTAQYPTSAGAEAEDIPAIIPLRLQTHGRLLGRFIFKQGTNVPVLIESAFEIDFTGTTANLHNNLGNLTYDASGHGNGYTGFQRGTTLSASDPSVNDDETKGYARGDWWLNTTSYTPFMLWRATTGAALWKDMLANNGKVYFISQLIGNNTVYTGRSWQTPFADITYALSVASAYPPSDTNRIWLIVTDAQPYIENFTLPRYISLIVPFGRLKGQIQLDGEQHLHFFRGENNGNDFLETNAYGTNIYIDFDEIKVIGNWVGIKNQSVLHRPFVNGNLITLEDFNSYVAMAIQDNAGGVQSHYNVKRIHFSDAGTSHDQGTACYFGGASGVQAFNIGAITKDSTVTNNRGFWNAAAGTLIANIDNGNCAQPYWAVGGKIIAHENEPLAGSTTGVIIKPHNDVIGETRQPYITYISTGGIAMTTPPTSTQGTLLFSASYTPKRIGNTLEISFEWHGMINGTNSNIVIAIFNGSTLVTYTAEQHGSANLAHLEKVCRLPVSSLTTLTLDMRVGVGLTFPLITNGNQTAAIGTECYILIRELRL